MTEVPQFYNAANLRDSQASTWKDNKNFIELAVVDIIS